MELQLSPRKWLEDLCHNVLTLRFAASVAGVVLVVLTLTAWFAYGPEMRSWICRSAGTSRSATPAHYGWPAVVVVGQLVVWAVLLWGVRDVVWRRHSRSVLVVAVIAIVWLSQAVVTAGLGDTGALLNFASFVPVAAMLYCVRKWEVECSRFQPLHLGPETGGGEGIPATADLDRVDLSNMALRHAMLRGANLTEARLRNADLSWADLSHACLRGADLSGALLAGADLTGADLRSAVGLTHQQLEGAVISESTLLPIYLQRLA